MIEFAHADDKQLMTQLYPKLPDSGCWIAGGTALSWYKGQATSSDIDLFFSSEKKFQKTHDLIENMQKKTMGLFSRDNDSLSITNRINTPNAVTFETYVKSRESKDNKRYSVQLIKRRYYDTVDELLDDFDITVCQIAVGSDGIHTGERFAADARAMRLSLHKPTQSTMKRVIKYWIYGYQPDDAVLQRLLDDETQNMEASENDY